jgi:GT2 family glycosyltransferase
MILPVSVLIPTLNRRERLVRTVEQLLALPRRPAEIIVVDASVDPVSLSDLPVPPDGVHVLCLSATRRGAAAQRNEAFRLSGQPFLLFSDDDVDCRGDTLGALWDELQRDPTLAACGVVLENQHYHPPGRLMRSFLRLLGCPANGSLAGRCCGPALNFLPELGPAPDRVDWINLVFTLCRREALPDPPLLDFFHGYSLMEDAALTMHIASSRRITYAPRAIVFHDMKQADYKDRARARERMEVVNRCFVMRHVMGRRGCKWELRLLAWHTFSLIVSLRSARGWRRFPSAFLGKLDGLAEVVRSSRHWRGYPSSSSKT